MGKRQVGGEKIKPVPKEQNQIFASGSNVSNGEKSRDSLFLFKRVGINEEKEIERK